MKKWLLLTAAIVVAVVGTMSLRATVDQPTWLPVTIAAYLTAFAFLGLSLREGIIIGVAYAFWGACGVALTAVLAVPLFGETLSIQTIIGLGVVIAGVVLVQSGSIRAEAQPGEGIV